MAVEMQAATIQIQVVVIVRLLLVTNMKLATEEAAAVDDLAKASLFYGDLTPAPASGQHWALLPLIQRVKRARGFGDFYQHVLVAEGAGEIAIDPEIQPWDVAPFMVIVEEAGGTVSSLRGERSFGGGSFVSSNGRLHDQAMAIRAVAASQSKLQQPQG